MTSLPNPTTSVKGNSNEESTSAKSDSQSNQNKQGREQQQQQQQQQDLNAQQQQQQQGAEAEAEPSSVQTQPGSGASDPNEQPYQTTTSQTTEVAQSPSIKLAPTAKSTSTADTVKSKDTTNTSFSPSNFPLSSEPTTTPTYALEDHDISGSVKPSSPPEVPSSTDINMNPRTSSINDTLKNSSSPNINMISHSSSHQNNNNNTNNSNNSRTKLLDMLHEETVRQLELAWDAQRELTMLYTGIDNEWLNGLNEE